MHLRATTGSSIAFMLLVSSALIASMPTALVAQGDLRPLQPAPPGDRPISPFMEGWYENEDGTYTVSFGYLNRNEETEVEIPLGEANYIEPARFDGMQPTTFLPGRHRGVFAVTFPGDMRDQDIWWYIENRNGEVHKVPGRTRAEAYQLDYNIRPQGSLHPLVWFESEEDPGRGPAGVTAEETRTTSVDSPVTLSVNVRDPSERDPEDPRYREPVPVRVVWFEHQAPGDVEFTRHPSTPEIDLEEEDDEGQGEESPPPPEEIILPEGAGTARVIATFSEPGEYLLRAQVDNFEASDSSSGNQCCWTNGFVRVRVSP